MYSRVVLAGKSEQATDDGRHRGVNFAASKFISSFSPKATTSQLQNLRIRKIFMKRHDKLNFSPTFSQLLDFLFVFEILTTYGCKRTHSAQLCSMPAMFKANERCYNRTFGLYGLEALSHRPELKILWDTFRSQIAELWFPYDRRIANDRR